MGKCPDSRDGTDLHEFGGGAFVSVASLSLRASNADKQQRIEELEAQIAEEEEKSEEIEEYSKYVQTKKYAEEVAKDKLGLVYEDEIIFKAED